MGNKENMEQPVASESMDYQTLDQMEIKLDQNKIDSIQKELDEKTKEFNNKFYAISMDQNTLNNFTDYIEHDVEWNGVEALGVSEIMKTLRSIKEEGGVKDSVIFMKALSLEASHYFISRQRSKGVYSAKKFLDIYRPLDEALDDVKKDNKTLQEIKTRLKAAQQGIEVA